MSCVSGNAGRGGGVLLEPTTYTKHIDGFPRPPENNTHATQNTRPQYIMFHRMYKLARPFRFSLCCLRVCVCARVFVCVCACGPLFLFVQQPPHNVCQFNLPRMRTHTYTTEPPRLVPASGKVACSQRRRRLRLPSANGVSFSAHN